MEIDAYPYQYRAAKHVINKPRGFLFLGLGLGKTVITLTAIKRLRKIDNVKGVLVVAPLRVVYNTWPEQIKKWDHLRNLTYTILHGKHKNKRLKEDVDIYLMNYEGIPWLYRQIWRKRKDEAPFNMIVFDESTKIKATDTHRFRYLNQLMRFFDRRLGLTGLPAPNSLLDLWAQYYLVDSGKRLTTSYTIYRDHYFTQSDREGYRYRLNPGANKSIANQVKDITLRLSAEDYSQLPDLIVNEVPCHLPDKLRTAYNRLERDLYVTLQETEIEAFNSASLSMKLRQFVQGGTYNHDDKGKIISSTKFHEIKIEALKDIKEDYNYPLIAAIQFRFEIDMLKKHFPDAPMIVGGVKLTKSLEIMDEWNKGNIPLLIVHPQTLSEGVNLQAGGCSVVWLGLTWSFYYYKQLNGRLYRQGQTRPVIIHHLTMRGTTDDDVINAIRTKRTTNVEFLGLLKEGIERRQYENN